MSDKSANQAFQNEGIKEESDYLRGTIVESLRHADRFHFRG